MTITNPAMGGDKRKYFIIGGGTVAAYLIYKYYKSKSSGTASAAATSTPSTTDPNAIDPVTGIPYSEESSYNGTGLYQGVGNPAAYFQGSNTFDAATGQWVPAGTVSNSTVTASSNGAFTPNWSAPYVTGDINQDTIINQSPYVAAAYQAYTSHPTAQSQQAYENAEIGAAKSLYPGTPAA